MKTAMKKKKLLDCGITKDRIIKILGTHGPMTAPELLLEIRKLRKTQDRPTLYKHLWRLERSNSIKRTGFKSIQKPYHKIIIWSKANLSE